MGTLKVLIIDDDEVTRSMLEKVIHKEGFTILKAKNGETGIQSFKNENPDIVICDLNMPDMNGLAVINVIRKLSSVVQIIVITAYNETETAISALHEGVLDYLKKPIEMELLAVAMGRAKEKILKHKKVGLFPNLLITDDEATIRKRLARELEKEGWTVYQASDGEEALHVFNETKIDVVLLDIKMPKKDGLQTLHEMRQITDDFEAIILTGYGDETSAVKAMRGGAINFLKKPIDLDQMIIAVEKALEKRNTDRSLKYRLRELELAQEIITKINAKKEIVIDISDHDNKPAKEFAQDLLDVMPVALVIVDSEMNIQFVNKMLKNIIETAINKVDETFINCLEKIGIYDIGIEELKVAINRMLQTPKGGLIECITTGKYSYITLTLLTVVNNKKRETVVMLMMRGERT